MQVPVERQPATTNGSQSTARACNEQSGRGRDIAHCPPAETERNPTLLPLKSAPLVGTGILSHYHKQIG